MAGAGSEANPSDSKTLALTTACGTCQILTQVEHEHVRWRKKCIGLGSLGNKPSTVPALEGSQMAATSPAAPLVDVHLLGWHLLPIGNLFKSGCLRAGWWLVPSVSSEKQTARWDENARDLWGMQSDSHIRISDTADGSVGALCAPPKHLLKPFLCLLHCIPFSFPGVN